MRVSLVIALTSILFVLPACKRQYTLETEAPAAAGLCDVTLAKDKTGNGTIDISCEHLAAPKDVDPSLSAYVVWGQVEGKDPFKLGIVDYKEKKRSGKLSSTVTDNEFTLMMTIEKDPESAAPVGPKILSTPVIAPKK